MFLNNLYTDIRSRYNIVWSFKGVFLAMSSVFERVPKDIDVVFFCHDVHRNAKKRGKLYAPLIDPIIESINAEKGFNTLTLATPFSQNLGGSCFTNVRILNYLIVIAVLKRIILRGSFKLQYIENDPLIGAYEKLLGIMGPNIVIGIQPSVELCIAAQSLGIKIYDMQHGLISDVNYYSIEKRKLVGQDGWPDRVLCWDNESADCLIRITNGFAQPLVVGHPSYHSSYGKELHDQNFAELKEESKYSNLFLVTLTYHNHGLEFEDEYYAHLGIPKELVMLMLTLPDSFWRIRLHPVQHKFHYKKVNRKLRKIFEDQDNVNWEIFSDISFGSAIRGCDGHITVSSASALDAAQNLVPTLFVGCAGVVDYKTIELYFSEYLNSGVMSYVNAADLTESSFEFFAKSDFSLEEVVKKNGDREVEFLKFLDQIRSGIDKGSVSSK